MTPTAARRERAAVLCVDTWLGDLNMRLLQRKKFARFMRLEHGMPQLHRVFLDRVVSHNLTDVVLPLALPSFRAVTPPQALSRLAISFFTISGLSEVCTMWGRMALSMLSTVPTPS